MSYRSSWRSPSNIALIKYWGKHGLQLPRNPSLSFTLSACHTDMKVEVDTASATPGLTVTYEGSPRPAFEPKIKLFLSHVSGFFPWVDQARITIDSVNTFPHGAGIASSASAMSALALCLMDIQDQMTDSAGAHDSHWWGLASEVARLGSGSACRSVFPVAAIWGSVAEIPESTETRAIGWEEQIAPVYHTFQDTILIVSANEKSVSSTAGHALMNDLAYAPTRYAVARENMSKLIHALGREDALDTFVAICETEALQLHALMMSGNTPFMLMEPGTVSVIKEVWRFRRETGIPVCFTLDAGPNVHLLYPAAYRGTIGDWIKTSLTQYCTDGRFIEDQVGSGPQKLER